MDGFQNEIPRSRINITLDIETNEGRKKKELPLKLLVMGDFSHRQSSARIADRERINITKENLDRVLKDITPKLRFTVNKAIKNDNSRLQVDLAVESMKGFLPEEIVKQVPELRNLLAMRNLLKDLKANILDDNVLRQELEKIMQDKLALENLRSQLPQVIQNQRSGDF